ncbi:MAG: aminopeptidase P N-terminal domain-containing protein [Acidobacteriota bacterium]|nr:aminopeptidase P N-terminal domain-containing protein [Acidobacteriota bacterium]
MNVHHKLRTSLSALTLAATILFSSSAGAFSPKSDAKNESSFVPAPAIRVTPPAPVFDDKARVAELIERRARVAKEIGPNGILVLYSAEPRVYTNDVDYEYRQENNLYYLTHLKQQGATLVLMPGHESLREILFVPKRNPARETWDGFMYGVADAHRLSGVSEIWEAKEFEPFMQALKKREAYRPKNEAILMSATATKDQAASSTSAANTNTASTTAAGAVATGFERLFSAVEKKEAALFLLVPIKEAASGEFGDHREWRREQRFAAGWKREGGADFQIRSAFPIFAAMRLRKSPSEIQRLQHAIDITTEAFGRSMAAAGRAQWEYEVEAEVEYTYRRRNADYWGYPSIVGCGPNATTLHYNESQGRINQGSLLLMDVGAEYDHYTADVTRTFPVNGKFTPAQADIYNIVYAAQEAAFRATRPGATISEVNIAATEVIKDGLLRLGLITDRNSNQHRMWFMHGTSHWLGMNVHDVGDYVTKFEPGMVFTNEPGIYVRADALDYLPKTPENEKLIATVRPAFEKYKNIGVRIEDDVLVTPEGYRNLSAALPRTTTDIEAFIARATSELRLTAIERQQPDSAALAGLRIESFIDPSGLWSKGDFTRLDLSRESLSFNPTAIPTAGRTIRRGLVFVGSAKEYARRKHSHADHQGE